MTAEVLSGVGAILLSLLLDFGLSKYWTKLQPSQKRWITTGLLGIVALVAYALSCYGPYTFFECTEVGAWKAIELFVVAVVTSQGTHSLIKREGV